MKDNQIKPVPEHFTSVTPWIISSSSGELIKFLKSAFEAEEIPNSRILNSEGLVIHVVVKIGNAMIMLFDSRKGWPPSPSFLNLYVKDIEQTYQKSLDLGARSMTDVTRLWFGEKVCRILDPFGNLWWINQRIEELDFTDPEIGKRASTPDAKAGIAYIQESLNHAMIAQKKKLFDINFSI